MAADTDRQGSALLADKEPFPADLEKERTRSPVKQVLCSHDSHEDVLNPRIRDLKCDSFTN